ncbi:MAG: dockerin type I repeat-containing protein, partial [Oscillospiraceae bacterium]|nr:dockerin type I repeat-containing protein [Oscillospiraceae bacterium]
MKPLISRGIIFKLLTAVLAITMMFSAVPLRVLATNNVEEATTRNLNAPDIFYGDFTGNGEIDGTDILWMNRYIQCDCDLGAMLQKYPSTITFSEAAADFTNDGIVDENDVLWISKYIAANCDAEAMIQRFSPEIDFS